MKDHQHTSYSLLSMFKALLFVHFDRFGPDLLPTVIDLLSQKSEGFQLGGLDIAALNNRSAMGGGMENGRDSPTSQLDRFRLNSYFDLLNAF